MGEKDLSKVIGLIMENPNLIAEIRALAEKSENTEEPKEETKRDIKKDVSVIAPEARGGSKRKELLLALKPYLSEERCKAVDQMLSIGDILDMMRNK